MSEAKNAVTNEAFVALANYVFCQDELQRHVYKAQVMKAVEAASGKGKIGNMPASEMPNFVQELVNQTGPGPDQLAINREEGYIEPVEESGTVLLGDSSLEKPRTAAAKQVVEDSKQGAANPGAPTADEVSKPAKEQKIAAAKDDAKVAARARKRGAGA